MLSSADEIVSFLFTKAIEDLDIPDDVAALAVIKYEEVGNWLGKAGDDWVIYPQGSFNLGTVVQPDAPDGEYDIDLVCLWGDAPGDLAPADLKGEVGQRLDSYFEWKTSQPGDDGPAAVTSSRRCWTLRYPDEGFHMDVLPAAPADTLPNIRLTDQTISDWMYSNPVGYAGWFRARSEELLSLIAKEARRANVAEVPIWRVRSTLQRLVQVLKWHCAGYFAGRPDDKPPSILITTLAAHAYAGETDLFTAALHAVRQMGEFVEQRDSRWWVANPAEPRENFADKWNDYPSRARDFRAWLAEITSVLDAIDQLSGQGIHKVVDRMEEDFAARGLIRKAAQQLGTRNLEIREAGGLGVTSSGLLTTGTGTSIRQHRFYGGQHGR